MEPKTHTPTQWYLVTNTPGVDIRHKIDGQELTLVENVNYQIANKIIRAANQHESLLKENIELKIQKEKLLEAALNVQLRLEYLQGHIDPDLERAIAEAEERK